MQAYLSPRRAYPRGMACAGFKRLLATEATTGVKRGRIIRKSKTNRWSEFECFHTRIVQFIDD